MKVRNGFVSNSSSSSFVVILPDNFSDTIDYDKIVEKNISEDTSDILYLIEFNNPRIGLYGLFTLNDNCQYLYMCFKIDKNISYWKLINRITD